ncbi:hypothetical protein B1690_04450 [Geobacillus sp. 46C-IIa]|nr:hypothetical protein B1690_04450 [Geobacillus sp. 46C-IIa]
MSDGRYQGFIDAYSVTLPSFSEEEPKLEILLFEPLPLLFLRLQAMDVDQFQSDRFFELYVVE